MALGNPVFTYEELMSFDQDQLRRICGYLEITFKKKDKKLALVIKIWDEIKPVPQEGTIEIGGQEVPVTVQLKRIQELLEK